MEWLVRYLGRAEMYDLVAVTMRGLLTNVKRERDGFQNGLTVAREAMAQSG